MTWQKTLSVKLNKSMSDNAPDNGVKPKKIKLTKKSTAPSPIPTLQQQPPQIPDAVIEQLIKDAIRIRVIERKNRQVDDELDAMVTTCQEFMKSFVILGYGLDGDQIPPIIVCNNQQEADAIGNYLQKFLHHLARNDGQIQ